jgi:hypothetical protein
VRDRLLGLLLFLPVPLVLALFTRQPLGTGASLALGVLVMATHRAYARPFALARARRRCLWCGGAAPDTEGIELREPLGVTSWRACGPAHRERAARTLGWAAAHRRLLQGGILGALLAFLVLAPVIASGRGGGLVMGDAVALFQAGVAVSVLPLGWLGPTRGRPLTAEQLLPFPVQIQALLGTLFVVWLFRLVGLWWLALALRQLVLRVGS